MANLFPQSRGPVYNYKGFKGMKYRLLVQYLLAKAPPIERLVLGIWHDITLWQYKREWRKRRGGNDTQVDIDKICWVDPETIKYASLTEFNIYENKGKTIGGDWDKLEKKFEELDVYIAFKQRFTEGKRWEDTIYYQRLQKEITDGEYVLGELHPNLDKRCAYLDTLYQKIKDEGYKARNEILSEDNNAHPMLLEDEIAVNVGRHGDLLFHNGAHRLSMVKLLGIRKIPVKITVRHPQWMSFRQQLLSYAQAHGGTIYTAISHPDLQDIPVYYSSEADRFSMIKENLPITKGRLLDIGAHWGYFCHKFEEIGFDCYAVENNSMHLYFLDKLRRAENRRFSIIPKSIFECQEIKELTFDVVLALNILHHFLKDKASYYQLCHLLKNLRMSIMYFQPHCHNEPEMEHAYKNYSEEEFVDFILRAANLKGARVIGMTRDGRKLYQLGGG